MERAKLGQVVFVKCIVKGIYETEAGIQYRLSPESKAKTWSYEFDCPEKDAFTSEEVK